jgi:hypothetical protein
MSILNRVVIVIESFSRLGIFSIVPPLFLCSMLLAN